MPTESPIEQQLRAENAELRAQLTKARLWCAAVESSDDAIITKNLHGIITSWNRGAERLFGYTAAEVVGGPLSIIAPTERLDEMPTILGRIRQGEKVDHFETLRRAKDGRLIDVSVTVSPLYDADDQVIGASKIVRDVSGQKRAEMMLRDNEQRMRLATEATGVGIWEWNIITNQIHWDAQMFRIYGITPTPDGIIPYSLWREHVAPEDLPQQEAILLNTARQGGQSSREFRILRADTGECRCIQAVETVRTNARGQIEWVVGTNLDVTERKLADTALRESREDLNRAQAVGQIGSWRLDVNRNVLTWSAENHRIFGVAEGTPMSYETFLDTIHPADREYVDTQWQAALHGEPYDIEHRIVANGQVKWVREKAYLELDATGKLLGGFGITQDTTGRKLAELALQEANHRKDEFLAMLAHELRNPLASIYNAVHIVHLTAPQNPTLKRANDMIGRQAQQLIRLVDDLLDVSRVSRGKITLRKEPLDMASVIRQAIETSQPLIAARQHQLRVKWPPQAIRVEGDATRLIQVVSNVLNNAAKYTDEGGTLAVTAEQVGNEAVIRVRDNGRGIDPVALNSLFELFYQVDRNLDRSDGGLGIGLSLVKSLVDMHGGYIEAHSAGLGKGSEFIIHLPCLPEEASIQPEVAGIPVKPARGQRILLVDDNRDVADSMVMLLTILGHDVLVSHDGRQAVEMALRERPAVVLLDIGLPGMDGYQACRAMRNGGLTDTLIVAMTGYGQEDDRRKAEEAGFDKHMPKPVDTQVLEDLLASLPVR
jgi:PAS domain S-box-containing protein